MRSRCINLSQTVPWVLVGLVVYYTGLLVQNCSSCIQTAQPDLGRTTADDGMKKAKNQQRSRNKNKLTVFQLRSSLFLRSIRSTNSAAY